jgi:hypothetical protein
MPTDHATTESRKTSWPLSINHHRRPNTTSHHGSKNHFAWSMQPATAGNVAAHNSPGGRKKMNALILTYLALIVLTFIVIVVLENNDDGGAA